MAERFEVCSFCYRHHLRRVAWALGMDMSDLADTGAVCRRWPIRSRRLAQRYRKHSVCSKDFTLTIVEYC
jgi:hypothetical protein